MRSGPVARALLCALLSAAGAAPPAGAQAAAPDLGVDAARLRPGTESLAIFLVRGGDTIRTGAVSDEIRLVEAGGERRLVRVYRSEDRVLGVRLDTIVDAVPGLAPIRYRSRSTHGAEALHFAADSVTGWITLANGDTAAVRAPLPSPVHGAASFDLVLRAAALRDGWELEVPTFLPSTRTVVPLRARVEGAEPIDGESCWRVEADFAGSAVTFWIGRETRRLCRQVMHVRPGTRLLFAPESPAEAPTRALPVGLP